MKKLAFSLLATLILIYSGASFAQTSLWQDVTPRARLSTDTLSARYFDSDDQALRKLLSLVPSEVSGQTATIDLPMPDGSLASFSIVESSIMETGLAEKYPQIKTYKVYGIDDPIASGRVDINDLGFHAMLQTSQGRIFIDPDTGGAASNRYLARTRDANRPSEPFYCSAGELVDNQSSDPVSSSQVSSRLSNRISGRLLTYRLAVSATQQYAIALGGTTLSAMSGITTAINRVNQIFELDHGIRLVLVANNSNLIDISGTSLLTADNSDGQALLSLNKSWIDGKIGVNAYDIGHVFSTGGGGVARLESVCNNAIKAEGVTGVPTPTGDPFYIDFVAHEIGHQFGAEHSFNGTTSSCGSSNRNQPTAMEPGSGSTIMAYAGLCGSENVQSISDATFHAISISQINTFVSTGGGASCDSVYSISNTDPTADAGIDRNIPANTAFRLSGAGTDIDADTLSYQWDQMDAGTQTTSDNYGSDLGDNALFRTYIPQCATDRDFPALDSQITGSFDPAEKLPTTTRSLNFRLTVRDSRTGQATDDVVLNVNGSAGQFQITSHTAPGITIAQGATPTVLWDVASTTGAPISCANVDIDLLTFSTDHSTYSVTSLLASTPNDSTETLPPIPSGTNAQARFRVKCSDNIFYDISDEDLNFTGPGSAYSTNQFATTFDTANTCNTGSVVAGDLFSSGISGGGGGSFASFYSGNRILDYWWLIILPGLLLGVSIRRARIV